jgi:K+-sensing histidine kinase KdpD
VGYELNLKHVNGTITPVLFNASVYNDDKGKIVGVFAAARDISAIRKAEEELIYLKTNLEQLVKQRAEDLIIINKELAFQNEEKEKRAAELIIADKELAYQSEEKADRAAELIIADKELAFQSEEKADRAAELIIANKELTFQNEEKEKRAAELIIANKELAFQNEEKDKRAAELEAANKKLGLQQEKIKEFNNQLEYRVKERTEQLESLNKELEAFSYSISHDLKAPLRHISGYVSLLTKKYGTLFPEDGKHYLEMISFSVENMGELIEGLLHFSRSGRIDMNKKFLNMNEIVEAIIQPIREQEIDRQIEFMIEPMHLAFGDLEMMKSVWSNLIENAVKFSRKKEFTKIVIGANEEKNETVYFIKDNGVGFDMNYASKLFTVFQRLHLRKDYEGTGIGLANVQRIITRHGGKIWAESKVGEGTIFYFSLINRRESEETWK